MYVQNSVFLVKNPLFSRLLQSLRLEFDYIHMNGRSEAVCLYMGCLFRKTASPLHNHTSEIFFSIFSVHKLSS